MTRPILVFGAGGRVGGALASMVAGSDADGTFVWSLQDITDALNVSQAVHAYQPAAIINLAACTLPHAEKPEAREAAERVNIVAPCEMSDIARKAGAAVVYISTDCVFDGLKPTPYEPDDECNPINVYGGTKRLGEMGVRHGKGWAHENTHIILRTTGVYLADKPNFLKLVLDKARAGESMDVISDTLYTPTDARELAKAILLATERVIEDPSVSGTYHFAGPDVMSYLDFAKLALEEAGLEMEIRPVTLAEREIVDGFKRPRNAALNSDKFADVFGLRHRPTRDCLKDLVNPA